MLSRSHLYLEFTAGRLRHSPNTDRPSIAQWQSLIAQDNRARYAVHPPKSLPSAFVLQHLLSVLAQPCAWAATLGPWLIDPGQSDDISPITFELAPAGYPTRIGFTSVTAGPPEREARLAVAHAAYEQRAIAIARDYDSGTKMSTRQREGMVTDMWQIALREARAARSSRPAASPEPPVQRQSCCFIYVLPGCHECAGCPRLR